TYSANKLSKLTDAQIDIIMYEVSHFTEKCDTNFLLCEKNSHFNMSNSSLNDILDNEISIPTESDKINDKVFQKKDASASKFLLETEVSITATPSIKSYYTSNLGDIVNKSNKFSETVTIIDSFSDSNLES
ncbi:2125_t:CDS:2, partial [Diversispora eburnea]